MCKIRHNSIGTAAAIKILIAAAFVLCISGCRQKTEIGDMLDMSTAPRQVGENIFATQTNNGDMAMRMEARRMEKYETDSATFELFPAGFDVYSYKGEDVETHIHSKQAKHTTWKNYREQWVVYGDVVITNFLNGQQMFTDTLYWDRYNHKIYTDCFVRMQSPRGYMQGYGMESDEQARNAEILRPFDSYSKIGPDSLYIYTDTANLIGPVLRPVPKGVDLKIKDKSDN